MIHGWVRDLSCEPSILVSWPTSELRVRLVIFLLTVPRWYFFCGSFLTCICLFHIVLPVSCSLVVTFGERTDLLALLSVLLCFCHFPIRCPGSGGVLDCIDSWSLPSSLLIIFSNMQFAKLETLHINSSSTFSNEPGHEISNNVVYATSKASDQPVHRRSLIRAFVSRLIIL